MITEPVVQPNDQYGKPQPPVMVSRPIIAPEPEPDPIIPREVSDLAGNLNFTITHRVVDTDAATATNYGPVFIAPFPCVLIKVQERHAVAGSDGSAVTLDVEKIPSGTAKGSGTTMLASTINLKATADTVQNGSLAKLGTAKSLVVGDAVGIKTSGTLTALKDVTVTLTFKVLIKNINA